MSNLYDLENTIEEQHKMFHPCANKWTGVKQKDESLSLSMHRVNVVRAYKGGIWGLEQELSGQMAMNYTHQFGKPRAGTTVQSQSPETIAIHQVNGEIDYIALNARQMLRYSGELAGGLQQIQDNSSAIQDFMKAIAGKAQNAMNALKRVGEKAKAFLKEIFEKIKNIILPPVKKLLNGIRSIPKDELIGAGKEILMLITRLLNFLRKEYSSSNNDPQKLPVLSIVVGIYNFLKNCYGLFKRLVFENKVINYIPYISDKALFITNYIWGRSKRYFHAKVYDLFSVYKVFVEIFITILAPEFLKAYKFLKIIMKALPSIQALRQKFKMLGREWGWAGFDENKTMQAKRGKLRDMSLEIYDFIIHRHTHTPKNEEMAKVLRAFFFPKENGWFDTIKKKVKAGMHKAIDYVKHLLDGRGVIGEKGISFLNYIIKKYKLEPIPNFMNPKNKTAALVQIAEILIEGSTTTRGFFSTLSAYNELEELFGSS